MVKFSYFVIIFLGVLLHSAVYAAGEEGPGLLVAVVHRNFDNQWVQVRDPSNRVLEVKAELFKKYGPLYHGKIVQMMVSDSDYRFVRNLDPQKELK